MFFSARLPVGLKVWHRNDAYLMGAACSSGAMMGSDISSLACARSVCFRAKQCPDRYPV